MTVKPFFCAVVVLAAACRSAPPAPPRPSTAISAGTRADLVAAIDALADVQDFSNAHWGILIVDPERAETLYTRNADKLFMPASNMKILTSATALARLGPDYRFATGFAARGTLTDGTLAGDVVVTGRGDPSLSDHMLRDAMAPLRAIADSIAARGIRRVTGHVVTGGNAFPDATLGFGWSWDDFEDSYSAPVDELLFNEGFSTVRIRAGGSPGALVTVETRPAKTFPRLRVTAKTIAAPNDTAARRRATTIRARKDSVTWDVVVEGDIVAGDSANIDVTHHDPRTAYLAAVREALIDRGIAVDGGSTDTSAALQPLATLSSPPLSEILKALMKPSQNQIAEMVFRAVALEAVGIGRADSARAVMERQMAQWGVTGAGAVIRDGSGLSRYNYISPRTTVRVLDAMRRAPTFRVYYDAMPIAGLDGTIRNRMRGTPAEGNVHAKTGTLAMARALSGYVTTANGRLLIFSMIANNYTANLRAVERLQDSVAVRLARMELR